MSWRLIIVFLVLAAGASAWAGLQLGDWLVAHGPTQIQAPPSGYTTIDETALLDAEGRPVIATAPQPLPDGRLGVPQQAPPVDWSIEDRSLMDEPSRIALATTSISLDEAIALAQHDNDELQGIGSLLDAGLQPVQPIDIQETRPDTRPARHDWQNQLQAELAACADLGFFSRPSCAWAARNKYCEPNNAWGKVDGCPSKKSGF